eukprot:GFUD01010280.1.p1 GENE.GFUD01010280.1~~GFUD01010280.1.p1  ORF type:complete len:1519 (+),score=509.70 GFUD01010280.1:91-4647(+)
MADDLMDFFNVRKEFPKIYLKGPQTMGRVRRSDFDEPPPETDPSLHCSDADWRGFIANEEDKLCRQAAESVHGTSDRMTVVKSAMSGIEGDTMLDSVTIPANDMRDDDQDLRKMFNFDNNRDGWKLPIIDIKEKIIDLVGGNQIVVLSGPTGCGKSTQVPQYILDKHAMDRKSVNIIVTQPRKIAASSVARRVCQERGWKLGGLVGYQVGLDKGNKSPDTRLLYVTTGILKRMMIAKKHLNDWTHIILDEVHEREEDMDLVMLLSKKLLFTNSRGTKLILMSATMNDQKFCDYFSSHLPMAGLGPARAPYLNLGHKKGTNVSEYHFGQLFKLLRKEEMDAEEPDFDKGKPQVHSTCIKIAKMLIKNLDVLEMKENANAGASSKRKEPGAVLVFLPGIHEIQTVRDYLMEEDEGMPRRKGLEWWCIPLHSSIPWEEHRKIFDPAPPNFRKIILSTNIAESSLTVPDIRYVVDFCLTKNMQADKDTNYPRLVMDWACKHQMIQRRGRAGRVTHDGRVFRLIPEGFYDSLPEEHVPEMQRVPLTKVVLDVKLIDLGSPKELLALAMDPPDVLSLHKTILSLKEMGALLTTVGGLQSREDGDLTVLGEIVAHLPIDVKLGKLIVLGHIFGVLEESIVIASGLNGKSIFTAPFDKRVQAYKNKLFWADRTFSDCFAILLAYQTWDSQKKRGFFNMKAGGEDRERQFCEASFLQKNQLGEMKMQVEDLTRCLKMMDIEPLQIQDPVQWSEESKFLILRLIMFGAFYPNYFTRQSNSEVEQLAHRTLLGRDPKNTVYLQGMDEEQAKFGQLYSGQIKKILQDCTKEEDRIKLSFEGRKIYVEFDRALGDTERSVAGYKADQMGNMTGDIIHQVYVAVKLRSQGGPMKKNMAINLYGQDIAEAKHREWQEAIAQSATCELTTEVIDQVAPPDMDVTELPMKLTYISSPSMFWTHYGPGVAKNEDRLQEIIAQNLDRCKAVKDRGEVKCGNVYLAPFKDKGDEYHYYYRARINSISGGGMVHVFFIDYGNVVPVAIVSLRMISVALIRDFPEIVKIPGLALECSLASIQPSKIRNGKGLWDEEVVERFKQLLMQEGSRVEGKIFSVTKSGSGHSKFVVSLDILEVTMASTMEVVEVKKALLRDKLAETAVESFLSQQNHRERMRYAAYNEAMQKHLNNYSRSDMQTPNMKPLKEDKTKLIMRTPLNGPFSPLEHKVLCAYRHGAGKLANVDPESVNHVMLDQAPSDPHDHWMVAAHVGISPSSETLLVRNTSWLPARPGLGALSTMIFAPQVEVRHNSNKSRLTGFIAGLGPKTTWDKPEEEITKVERTLAFYPEHDMEVKFDIDVTNQDINSVNKLRYWVNQMLSTEDHIMCLTQPKKLDLAQKGIKRNLEELLERERKYEEKVPLPAGHEYRWNMLKAGMRMQSQLGEQDKNVYKMIDGVRVTMEDSKVVMEKLVTLYSRANETSLTPLASSEVCPACPGQLMMSTPRDIWHHFHSKQHKVEEDKLVQASEKGASSYAGSVTSGR